MRQFFGNAFLTLLPGILLAAFAYSFFFVLCFATFVDQASTNIFSILGESILMALFAILAVLLASLPAYLLLVLFWLTMKITPDPNLFSSLLTNWSMIPIGYGAAVLVGFSIYPDEIYLMIVFASAPLFGTLFGILYSRLMIRFQKPTDECRTQRSFSLRSLFVITGWIAVLLAVALSNDFAFLVAIACIPCSLIGWVIVTILPDHTKPELAR